MNRIPIRGEATCQPKAESLQGERPTWLWPDENRIRCLTRTDTMINGPQLPQKEMGESSVVGRRCSTKIVPFDCRSIRSASGRETTKKKPAGGEIRDAADGHFRLRTTRSREQKWPTHFRTSSCCCCGADDLIPATHVSCRPNLFDLGRSCGNEQPDG